MLHITKLRTPSLLNAAFQYELKIEFKIEPRDLWIGLYWKRSWFLRDTDVRNLGWTRGPEFTNCKWERLELFICIIPILVTKITINWTLVK